MDEPRPGTWPVRVIGILLVLVFVSGFINHLVVGGIPPATAAIDSVIALMTVQLVLKACSTKGRVVASLWVVLLFVTAVCYLALFVASPEPLNSKLIGFRNHIGYAVVALYAFVFIREQVEINRLVTLALRLAVAIAVFGIIQSLVPEKLPPELLAPVGEEHFGYYQTDIVRSNGLVGNTIVYATLLVLFYALHLARWAAHPRLWTGLSTLVMLLAILTTYSRVAIAGAAAVGAVVLVMVLWRRNPAAFVTYGIGATALTLFVGWLLWPTIHARVEATFLWRGLFSGTNASVRGSDAGHEADIRIGRELFSEHPLTGVGIATQAEGSNFVDSGGHYITDGAIWARLAEGGLFLAIPYAALLIAVFAMVVRALHAQPANWLAAGFLGFMAFEFTVASVYNSAFFGKAVFLSFWVLVGLIGAGHRLSNLPNPDAGHQRVAALSPLSVQPGQFNKNDLVQ